MPLLTADNRELTNGAKYSFLSTNYLSGLTSFILENSEEFKADDFVLIGQFGSSYTEIRQISYITRASDTVVLTKATSFPHSESTRMTVINYDQVRFFQNSTASFSVANPVLEYVSLGTETTQFDITNPTGSTFRYTYDTTGVDPNLGNYIQVGYTIITNAQNFTAANNDTFTVTGVGTNYFEVTNATGVAENNKTIGTGSVKILTNYLDIDTSGVTTSVKDTSNSTGFGFFVFYNSSTSVSSQNSNAIPYAGFAENSVESIINNFFGLLNNKELKLISYTDAIGWLNEAYSIAKNELNLVNKEYAGSDESDITIVSGTAEYSLPTAFSDLLSITTEDGVPIGKIDLSDVGAYNTTAVGGNDNQVRYYLRGDYIGFAPTPTASATYKLRNVEKTTALTSMYENVELPDNNFYHIKDYMLFRAAPKLNRTDGPEFYKLFFDAIERMKLVSIKRDGGSDAWYIDAGSNI